MGRSDYSRSPGASRKRRETPEQFRRRLLTELRQEREALAERIKRYEKAEAALSNNTELES